MLQQVDARTAMNTRQGKSNDRNFFISKRKELPGNIFIIKKAVFPLCFDLRNRFVVFSSLQVVVLKLGLIQ